jgi:hypothetical protein
MVSSDGFYVFSRSWLRIGHRVLGNRRSANPNEHREPILINHEGRAACQAMSTSRIRDSKHESAVKAAYAALFTCHCNTQIISFLQPAASTLLESYFKQTKSFK